MDTTLMAPATPAPERPDKGHETGETGWLWSSVLLDWGQGLALQLTCLQAAVRDLQGEAPAACMEEMTARETYGIPLTDETAGSDGGPDGQ